MEGIFPALLQKGREVLIPYLIRIFCACLSTGYVPAVWGHDKVVFIPKPGRNSYCGRKDFIHISLTPFLLTILERVVGRFLRDEMLVSKPLSSQPICSPGWKVCRNSSSSVRVRVEKALDQQEIALGIFLDIEGAFNNISYDSMCAALVRHSVDYTIV